MTVSKYCSNCKKLVSTNSEPKFCVWCGKDLNKEPIFPKFETYQKRVDLIFRLRAGENIFSNNIYSQSEQLSLF